MLDTLHQRRFAVARSSTSYQRACWEDEPKVSLAADVARLIVSALVLGGLLFVLAATGRQTVVLGGVVSVVAWVALLVDTIRTRTGPLVHRLAIVKSAWTNLAGASAEIMTVRRSVTLVHEDGSEVTYSAPNTAAGIVEDGEIGVAITRRGSLVRFISLDT